MKKYKEIKNYWADDNGNKWSTDLFSEKAAKKRSEHMINCHFCQDCGACENCWGCKTCISCKGCESCLLLTYCIDCFCCEGIRGYKNLENERGLKHDYKIKKITKREKKGLLNINYEEGELDE